LAGGESLDVEIADSPHLGEHVLRHGRDVEIYDVSDAQSFSP
jgi:hypothetical protein